MAEFKNYYQILELEAFADAETVKNAYRQLARKFHPDLNADNPGAEEKFKGINEAYEVLGNSEKRGQYDQTLRIFMVKQGNLPPPKTVPNSYKTAAQQTRDKKGGPKPDARQAPRNDEDGPATSTPINDLFESFKRSFGQTPSPTEKPNNQQARAKEAPKNAPPPAASAKPKAAPPPPPKPEERVFKTDKAKRGEDVTVEALITPGEAEQGVVKTVNVQHSELCRKCAGTGRINGLLCSGCNGEKVIVRLKKLDVRIPAGVKHGSRVRIAREGGRGINSGEPGDLFLQIKISVDPALKIEGLNVHCDLVLSVPEAVLGAEIEVPTLSGKVKMSIPPLTSSGKVFRLKDQGVKNGNSKGDQFVTVQIAAPTQLSAREKELYQELGRLHRDNKESRP